MNNSPEKRFTWTSAAGFGLAVCLILVTGCAADDKSRSTAPSATPDNTIIFERSGGIAGVHDKLSIDPEGNSTLSRKNATSEFRVDQRRLDKIERSLRVASFSNLDSDYAPDSPVPDSFRYSVTYRGHTVTATDSTLPDKLGPVIGLLQEEIESHRAR